MPIDKVTVDIDRLGAIELLANKFAQGSNATLHIFAAKQ